MPEGVPDFAPPYSKNNEQLSKKETPQRGSTRVRLKHPLSLRLGLPVPLVPPVGKEAPRGTTSAPRIVSSFVGALTLILYWDCRGTCRAQPKLAPKLTIIETTYPGGSEKGLTSTQILADQVHSCKCSSSNPSHWLCSSAEPSWGHTLTRGISGVQICLTGIHKGRVLLTLKPSLLTSGKEDKTWPHPLWRVTSGSIWQERKAGNSPWELCGPSALDCMQSNSRGPVQSGLS